MESYGHTNPATHEALGSHTGIEPPSERSFALVFAAFFAIVAFWPVLKGHPIRWWAAAASPVMLLIGLAAPKLLRWPNLLWFQLGMLLNKIVSPIVISALFFLVFMPFGLILRLAGKDLLRLRLDPKASSYWIDRTPPGPKPESMVEQF